MNRPDPRYLPRVDQWDALARLLLNPQLEAGLDSEFYGCDLGRESTETVTGRGVVHVWSVGLPSKTLHPRGYFEHHSVVLPSEALRHAGLRYWLMSTEHRKWAHNKGMEEHAIENTWRNHGFVGLVAGVHDTLGLSRWCFPHRVVPGAGGFTLDSLGSDILGRGKVDDFESILEEPNVVTVDRKRTTHRNVCQCGAVPCRRRGAEHQRHRETSVERWTEDVVRGTRLMPLETVLPGHERWERLVKYAGVDAELAPELAQVCLREISRNKRELPW